jgi:hypothetical protein
MNNWRVWRLQMDTSCPSRSRRGFSHVHVQARQAVSTSSPDSVPSGRRAAAAIRSGGQRAAMLQHRGVLCVASVHQRVVGLLDQGQLLLRTVAPAAFVAGDDLRVCPEGLCGIA